MPDVAIVGGSLGGLTAGLLLRELGCRVRIYERSASELQARGAGIAVLRSTWRYPVERLGVPADRFSSSTAMIRFLRADGSIECELDQPYLFSSWNAIYRVLLEGFEQAAPGGYLLGSNVVDIADTAEAGDRVAVTLASGAVSDHDLVICADGITSPSRSRLLPDVQPQYSGYIAWRGVIPERDLSEATYARLHDALTYQILPNSHILVYPIPSVDGAVEPGSRLMNIVWYRNVEHDQLDRVLTDVNGERRAVSVPPGLVAADVIAEMRDFAEANLGPAIAEVVTGIEEPFIQAVYDIDVPQMAFGRTCLIGDAAFAVRPHAAAGTAKAAEDGWVLAEELESANGNVLLALERWQERQLDLGRALLERTRRIGASSQFTGGFTAGDPELIFGLYGPGN
jgi:2,6-dihydroxypyridine 3-monooxygenase